MAESDPPLEPTNSPGFPDVTMLHDWLVMRPESGDDASAIAAHLRDHGLSGLQLSSRQTRSALRVLFDEMDAYDLPLAESLGVFAGGGQIARLRQSLAAGTVSPQLIEEVLQTLAITADLLRVVEALGESQPGEEWAQVRSGAESLRMLLSDS